MDSRPDTYFIKEAPCTEVSTTFSLSQLEEELKSVALLIPPRPLNRF